MTDGRLTILFTGVFWDLATERFRPRINAWKVRTLVPRLRSRRARVRQDAALKMAVLKHPLSAPSLRKAMYDSDTVVRVHAISGLARLKDTDSV
ncbi:MAG: hypothetical protein LC772_03260, partial [Chloroflexi bacterium]|nr:hypothetical protein [Chloroflexota bacterium]